MALKDFVQHWFQKRSSVITTAQATMEMMMRFNSLVRSDPKDIIDAIDNFNIGYLDPLARLVADYEQRDDKMRVASIKMASAVSRCGWTVRPKKGFEDDPAAAHQVEVLERFWSTIRVTSAFKRNELGGLSLLEEQMMSAQSYGFACHDLSWTPLANGEIEATFTHVPLWHFENHTGTLRYLPTVGAWDGVEMKRGEWMVSTGDGIGIAAAIVACMKRLGLTNWLLFTDRCVLPLIHAKTSAAYGSEQWENLKKALNNINRLSRIVTDRESEIGAIQMDGGKQNPFGPLIEWADRAIVTLYRGGDLATISRSDAVGGIAQADETDSLEQRSCRRITETLNEQVGAFVVDYVLGQRLLAEIVIEPVSKPDVKQDMEIDNHLVGLGVKLSKTDALSRYGRAEAETDDDALVLQTPTGETPATAPQLRASYPLQNAGAVAKTSDKIGVKTKLPNESSFKTPLGAFKTAPRKPDGQVDPSNPPPSQIAKKRPSGASGVVEAFIEQNTPAADAVKAVLANPTPSAFATLMMKLPGLMPEDPALAAVIADAMAEKFGEVEPRNTQTTRKNSSVSSVSSVVN
jgi:phage gp29-like protein